MSKTLCKWSKKDICNKNGKLLEEIQSPRFFCTSCARVAKDKDLLCKAKAL